MWRALVKGSVLGLLGRLPGGAEAYRNLTRKRLGTQATHVDKLARVWPAYIPVWTEAGVYLDGADLWVHEGGWTAFPALAAFLLTGKGGVTTNVEAQLLNRYLVRSVRGALTAFPSAPAERRERVSLLRWSPTVSHVLEQISAALFEAVDPTMVPLPSRSQDLCHTGGSLEHYRPDRLRSFLEECLRVLRPGGVASHVFDHRDHLHHADRRLPYLMHYSIPEPLYEYLLGSTLTYHNRLTPTEVCALFESTGFELIKIRRMILPEQRYASDEEVLASTSGVPFAGSGISQLDRRSAAVHYLYRKPLR